MNHQKSRAWRAALPGLTAFLLLLSILASPKEAYEAALSGLDVFLHSVFPALLPFFIASEIMAGLGVVDFLSVLLDPIMGPLFRCPGCSSFIWIMSITSGYPTGARLVSMFRKQKKITVDEAQRILSFCSTSGPLFLVGAVSVSMLNSPKSGTILLISHFSAAILIGLAFRFYHTKGLMRHKSSVSLPKALSALSSARKRDGRPIGQIMGDSVRNSVNVLLMVGGFIILFSVIIDLLMRIRVIDALAAILSVLLKPFRPDPSLIKAVIGGMIEMTAGGKLVSAAFVSMDRKIAAVSFLIGWSGLSIHAQTAGILSGTGIRFRSYILGKFFHGLIAALISLPLTRLLYPEAAEVSAPLPGGFPPDWKEYFLSSWKLLFAALLCIALAAAISYARNRNKKKGSRKITA